MSQVLMSDMSFISLMKVELQRASVVFQVNIDLTHLRMGCGLPFFIIAI